MIVWSSDGQTGFETDSTIPQSFVWIWGGLDGRIVQSMPVYSNFDCVLFSAGGGGDGCPARAQVAPNQASRGSTTHHPNIPTLKNHLSAHHFAEEALRFAINPEDCPPSRRVSEAGLEPVV